MGPNAIFVNFQISQFFKYIQREIRVGRKEAGQADAIWIDTDAQVYSLLPPQGSGKLEQRKRVKRYAHRLMCN